MQTNEAIKKSLDYIEQNLKTIITIEELATIASYSVWHYCRLFSQIVGLPIAGYISKRRLENGRFFSGLNHNTIDNVAIMRHC